MRFPLKTEKQGETAILKMVELIVISAEEKRNKIMELEKRKKEEEKKLNEIAFIIFNKIKEVIETCDYRHNVTFYYDDFSTIAGGLYDREFRKAFEIIKPLFIEKGYRFKKIYSESSEPVYFYCASWQTRSGKIGYIELDWSEE